MRVVPFAAILAVAAASASCTAPPVGQGPIRLSPRVQAYYQGYRQHMSPGAFAVSADGQEFGGMVCGEFGGCRGDDVSGALTSCRRSGKECFIYDIGGMVVWLGLTTTTRTIPARTANGGVRNPV